MKKAVIKLGVFVGGVIMGAAAMLIYKNIQFGKKSKLHEENYNNLNDIFKPVDPKNNTTQNIFAEADTKWSDELSDEVDEDDEDDEEWPDDEADEYDVDFDSLN